MVLTPSTMRELGTAAPDFSLPDASGRIVSLRDFSAAPGLLVVFWCSHCPFVKHIKSEFAEFAREYADQDLAIVAINANDIIAFPQDGPEAMLRDIEEFNYSFNYLIDKSQNVAKAYGAVCTPEFFLFDNAHKLAYHGQFDASRPRNDEPVDGRDLRAAAGAVLAQLDVAAVQTPSIGCSIKWRE